MGALTPVVTAVGGYILGVFTILVTRFGEGGINEFYENRKKTRGSKNKMGEEIRSFCIAPIAQGSPLVGRSRKDIVLISVVSI